MVFKLKPGIVHGGCRGHGGQIQGGDGEHVGGGSVEAGESLAPWENAANLMRECRPTLGTRRRPLFLSEKPPSHFDVPPPGTRSGQKVGSLEKGHFMKEILILVFPLCTVIFPLDRGAEA